MSGKVHTFEFAATTNGGTWYHCETEKGVTVVHTIGDTVYCMTCGDRMRCEHARGLRRWLDERRAAA